MTRFLRAAPVFALALLALVSASRPATAQSISVPGLTLTVAPIVDVGAGATFSLTAHSWPVRGTASLRFVSPHHGFTGSMPWDAGCGCFLLKVRIGRRVHPLEGAQAWATLTATRRRITVSATFAIRGLQPDGRHFAPGGAPQLDAWVGDPRPLHNQAEHFCAWVHASDGFGLQGMRVRFVLNYPPKSEAFTLRTNAEGFACNHRSIGAAPIGVTTRVDVYVAKLHRTLSFAARA